MDATPTLNDVLKVLAGGAVLAAWKLLRQHIKGRRIGQVFENERKDGRESRVIPRPQAAEVTTARQDVQDVKAGLEHLESEVRRIEAKVDEQGQRFAAHAEREEEDRASNNERLVETNNDVKTLISEVGKLTGQVAILVDLQARRRLTD